MEEGSTERSIAKSLAAFKTAGRLIPGGVNSPLYAASAPDAAPVFIARGQGATLSDLDGNEYIDYTCARGSLILGHADERVVVAIGKAAAKGYSFGAPTESEVRLAELIAGRLSSIELVRLVNSTTEAALSAIRLARGFTGRDTIIRFEGCYHGFVDALLGGTMYGGKTSTPHVPVGVPAGATADTLIVPYNNLDAVGKVLGGEDSKIAAVIVPPIATRMGLVPPLEGFLTGLRELCDEHGTLLIFDETVTGFRVGPGGATMLYGVGPDLTIFGSIVGGGLPLGAYGGRREIMSYSPPAGEIFQPGTLSGNPLAVVSGIASLQATAEEGFYENLEHKAERLDEGLRAAAAAANVETYQARVGSILCVLFTSRSVTDFASAQSCDSDMFGRYFGAMLERGVFLPPSRFECLFVSAAHTDEQIDRTIEAAHESLGLIGGPGA